jgi:hypothetical protein
VAAAVESETYRGGRDANISVGAIWRRDSHIRTELYFGHLDDADAWVCTGKDFDGRWKGWGDVDGQRRGWTD